MPTRLTTSCSADFAATSHAPTVAATTAKPAAVTVYTEMKTPTSPADFAETSESMPAAPASSATTNDSGPTWKMKSTSSTCWMLSGRDPADAVRRPCGERGDRHRDRETDDQCQRGAAGQGEAALHESDRQCGQRTELGTQDHGSDDGDGGVGHHSDRGEQACQREKQDEGDRQRRLLPGTPDEFVPDHGVGRVALGLVLGPVRPRRQDGVEDGERDRAAMLHVEGFEILDDVVGAFARDVGGDLVPRRLQRRTLMQQDVGHPDLAPQYLEDVVSHVLGSDHPQVQHG